MLISFMPDNVVDNAFRRDSLGFVVVSAIVFITFSALSVILETPIP